MARETIRRIPWVLGGCVAVVVMAVAFALPPQRAHRFARNKLIVDSG